MLKKCKEHTAEQTIPAIRFAALTLLNNHYFYTGNTCTEVFMLPVATIRAEIYVSG